MLESPDKKAPTVIEAVVISVDVRRKVCKVIADNGQLLRNVSWYFPHGDGGRSGDNFTPMPRDRVKISNASGYTYIVSGAGYDTYDKEYLPFIAARREVDDLEFFQRFNLTHESGDKNCGSSRPEDSQPGDRIISSQGGSMLGVLNSGSILAKASSLSQIFLSKFDDLVRVISRNYELFSDASKRVDANVVGDVYNYEEYYRTQESSRNETPEYWEARGNTLSATTSKGNYIGQTSSLGINDTVKMQAVDEDSIRRWTHTLSTEGYSLRRSQSSSNSDWTEELLRDTDWTLTVQDSSGSHTYSATTDAAIITVEKGGQSSVLTLGADGQTVLDASVSVVVNTPSATVNAATDATLNTAVAAVNASTTATVTTPALAVNAAASTFSGTVAIAGAVTMADSLVVTTSVTTAAVASASVVASGPIAGATLSAGGLDMGTHVHGGVTTGTGTSAGPAVPAP